MSENSKIVFNKDIDSKITGIALILAFLITGLFLIKYPNYFGNELISKIIRWVFIIIGVLGIIAEFQKNKNSNIKGFDNLVLGIVLIGIWAFLFIYTNAVWVNALSFILFPVGCYGLILGIIQICYSSAKALKSGKNTKQGLASDIILLMTKIASLILVIIQAVKVLIN